MTKAKISEYDASAGSNTDVNGVNIAEGCAPSGINNAIREVMAALKRFETGSDGDSVTVGGSLVVSGSTTVNTFSTTLLNADNITIDGNTISSTNSNGNITLAPNGTGRVQVSGTTSNSGGIELFEDTDNGTNKVLLTVPASIASDVTATIPATTTTLAGLAVAQTFSVSQRGTVTTDNDGSFDMNATNNFLCTPTGGVTLTFTNITAGQSGNIVLVNGSNHTVSAAAATKVAATTLAAISATGTYWLSYYSPDGTNVYVANTAALA